jgi:hypothetical protein
MTFQEYIKGSWLNVGHGEKGWFVTRDAAWTLATMRREGWSVQATGETELMPDDTRRVYFKICPAA